MIKTATFLRSHSYSFARSATHAQNTHAQCNCLEMTIQNWSYVIVVVVVAFFINARDAQLLKVVLTTKLCHVVVVVLIFTEANHNFKYS